MATQMNDIDFEEKLLLSSLHHHTIQHQPLNLPDNYNSYIGSQNRYDDYPKHRRDYNRQQYHSEPSYTNDNQNLVATISMSTEEDMLDDFELNFEGDQPNIVDTSSIIKSNNNNSTVIDHTDTATVVTLKSTAVPKSSDEKFVVTPELPRNITMDTQQLSATSTKPKKKRTKSRKNSPSRKKTQEPSARVEVPKNEDILCGQSRVCASHPGNQTFQRVLGDYAHQYDIATSKQEKMQMTKAIVSIIHDSGGRFLKYKDGMWEEISTVAARDKVSHALRTKVSSWKRQHQQLLQKEKDPFAPPKRTILSRQSRKRSIRDVGASPTPFQQESSKFNSLLQSQQANFANLTTPTVSPSRHHVRHSYAGEFYQNHHSSIDNSSNHSRRSSSTF